MSRGIQMVIGVVVIVAVVSIGAFFYLTRDIAAPSTSVQDSVEQLEVTDVTSGEVVFRISQDDSQVEYNIYELLNGTDKTVVGTTSEVAGDIALNLSDLSQIEVGAISINARTFATDDDRRDNAVARFILQSESDANEFITFQPTSVNGLPENIEMGETLEFQITGDLTIAGVTQTTTFDLMATLETEDRLIGQAEAVVQRSDFNLSIPSVPFVANVGEDVTLKLEFVANAVTA